MDVNRGRTAWLGLLLAVTGCSSEFREPLSRQWQSEHFVYLSRPDDTSVVEQVMPVLEEHLELFQQVLGPITPTQKFVYRKYLDKQDFDHNQLNCPASNACSYDGTTETPLPLDPHELTHIYMNTLGAPGLAMQEGIATAFDCGEANEAWLPQSSALPDPDLALGTMNSSLLAQFMVWLLENKSIDSFRKWYESGSRGSSVAEMHAAFDATYGESLVDTWQLALSTERRNSCFPLLECDAPLLTESATLQAGLDGRPAAVLLPEQYPVLLTVESGENLNFVACEATTPLLSALFVDLPSPNRRNLWNSNGHRFAAHLVDWDGDRIPSKTLLTVTQPQISQLDNCSPQPVYQLSSWQDHVLLPPVPNQISVTVDAVTSTSNSGLSAEVGDLPLYYPGPRVTLCGPCDAAGSFTCVELSNGSASGELVNGYYSSDVTEGKWLSIEYTAPNGTLLDLHILD